MIIKATRLQAWAPAGGGGSKTRPSPRPPEKKIIRYVGAFLLLFLHMGAFLLRFSHFVGIFTMWGPFCYILFYGGGFFSWLAPPLRIFLRAPMIAIKEGSRACSPELFLCDRKLVSSGHVLLRFCLKNDKNNDKL